MVTYQARGEWFVKVLRTRPALGFGVSRAGALQDLVHQNQYVSMSGVLRYGDAKLTISRIE